MENQYFKQALGNMVASVAYVDAVRHLYDIGYSVPEIQKNLSFPASIEQIEKTIADYEAEKKNPESQFEYVQRMDEYGRRSFVKVRKE